MLLQLGARRRHRTRHSRLNKPACAYLSTLRLRPHGHLACRGRRGSIGLRRRGYSILLSRAGVSRRTILRYGHLTGPSSLTMSRPAHVPRSVLGRSQVRRSRPPSRGQAGAHFAYHAAAIGGAGSPVPCQRRMTSSRHLTPGTQGSMQAHRLRARQHGAPCPGKLCTYPVDAIVPPNR